jgi:proline iminopeptidase
MRKRRIVIIGSLVVVLLLVTAAVLFWSSMGKALYRPGMVRAQENLRGPLEPPGQPADPNFWKVESDIRLYHYSDGQDRKVLVVHGGPGYPIQEAWEGLRRMNKNHEFIYYDQRGCGRSTRPIDRFSSSNYYKNMTTLEKTLGIGAQVADIERIRRIIGEEKLILLGHSFGAFLASMYAAEFPENVKAMILVSPASVLVMPASDGDLFEAVARRLPQAMKEEYADFLKRYLDFSKIFSQSESDLASLNSEFGKYYMAAYKIVNPSATATDKPVEIGGWMVQGMYFSMGKRHDYRSVLRSVQAPVLVIHGENDLQSEQASRTYVNSFANSRFHLIEKAGHFSFAEQPEEYSAAIAQFLNEIE